MSVQVPMEVPGGLFSEITRTVDDYELTIRHFKAWASDMVVAARGGNPDLTHLEVEATCGFLAECLYAVSVGEDGSEIEFPFDQGIMVIIGDELALSIVVTTCEEYGLTIEEADEILEKIRDRFGDPSRINRLGDRIEEVRYVPLDE